MAEKKNYKEYIYLRPDELETAISEFPLAWITMGALEWHSFHLPLGTDGIKAESLLRRTAEKLGSGVLFPCRYWGQLTDQKILKKLGQLLNPCIICIFCTF